MSKATPEGAGSGLLSASYLRQNESFTFGVEAVVQISPALGGYIDIFKQTADTTAWSAAGKTATRAGARTSLYIPALSELIVACPSGFSKVASLLIYKIKTQ